MAYPLDNLATVRVTAQYLDIATGLPMGGSVTFTPSQTIRAEDGDILLLPAVYEARLRADGSIQIDLPVGDADEYSPEFVYHVVEKIVIKGSTKVAPGGRDPFSINLTTADVGVDYDLIQAPGVTIPDPGPDYVDYFLRTGGTITGDVTVASDMYVTGTLFADAAEITGFTVTDDFAVPGDLAVAGAAALHATTITGAVTASGAVTGGSLSTAGTLAAGATTITGAVAASGAVTGGSLSTAGTLAAGATTITGAAGVSGALTAGSLSTAGTLAAGASTLGATTTGTLGVTGTTTITGAATVSSTLGAGATTLASAIVSGTLAAGATTITGAAGVSGAVTAGSLSTAGTLAAGATTITGAAGVSGAVTAGSISTAGTLAAGATTITGAATVSTTLGVTGALTAGSVSSATVSPTTLTVSGDGTVAGTLSVAGGLVVSNPTVLPTDTGYLAWAYDPLSAVNSTAPTTQVMYLQRMQVRKSVTVGKIAIAVVSTAGMSLTTGECFVALYDSTGARIGVSADISATLTTSGEQAFSLTAGVPITAGFYWAAILLGGSTLPTLARAAGGVANLGSGQLTASTRRFGSYGTGQTATPSPLTPASIASVTTQTYWSALVA